MTNFKKHIVLIGGLLILLPAISFGQTSSPTQEASIISSLQSLLGTLQQQLFSLLQTTNYRLQTGNQLAQISGSGSGLIAHYTFDEGSGTMAGDSSGNGNTGTLTPTTGGPTWTTDAKVGSGAISLDGVNDYVSTPDSISLRDLPNTALTIASWLKVNNNGTNAYVISKQAGSTSVGWIFKLDSSRRAQFTVQRGTTDVNVLSSINTIPVYSGDWFHVAVTYPGGDEADTVRLYINGADVAGYQVRQDGSGVYSSDAGREVRIGRSEFNAYANVSQDDLRVYSRALTPSEITELYN